MNKRSSTPNNPDCLHSKLRTMPCGTRKSGFLRFLVKQELMIKLLLVSLIIKQLQYCIFNARLQTMTRMGRKTGLTHICKWMKILDIWKFTYLHCSRKKAFFEARASKSKKKTSSFDRRENLEYHYFSPKINISKLERSKIIATRKKSKETQELQITN